MLIPIESVRKDQEIQEFAMTFKKVSVHVATHADFPTALVMDPITMIVATIEEEEDVTLDMAAMIELAVMTGVAEIAVVIVMVVVTETETMEETEMTMTTEEVAMTDEEVAMNEIDQGIAIVDTNCME